MASWWRTCARRSTARRFPNVGAQLMDIINYAFKLAEGRPISVDQPRQDGRQPPETFGAAEIPTTTPTRCFGIRAIRWMITSTEPVVHQSYGTC